MGSSCGLGEYSAIRAAYEESDEGSDQMAFRRQSDGILRHVQWDKALDCSFPTHKREENVHD